MLAYGKAKYMKSQGWKTVIFYPGLGIRNCVISDINEYRNGANYIFDFLPASYTQAELDRAFQWMNNVCNDVDQYNQIIVESHYLEMDAWAEYFSQRSGARHYIYICPEDFESEYIDYADFYRFKLHRGEIPTGVNQKFIEKVIPGEKQPEHVEDLREYEAIQDIDDENVAQISSADWSIAYIGRTEKKYVPNVINGVIQFAGQHANKKINFVIVGRLEDDFEKKIREKIKNLPNICLIPLGDMIPIPRDIFAHLDVVIAGAQSAVQSAYEHIPVIAMDAINWKANGILGYTCDLAEAWYHNPENQQFSVSELLEEALIKKGYLNFHFFLPERKSSFEIYESNFKYEQQLRIEKKYFDVTSEKFQKCLPDRMKFSKKKTVEIDNFLKRLEQHPEKVLLFGAGIFGRECLEWMQLIKGVSPAFILDNDSCEQSICGVLVKRPEEVLLDSQPWLVIISSTKFADQMKLQTEKLNPHCTRAVYADLKKSVGFIQDRGWRRYE